MLKFVACFSLVLAAIYLAVFVFVLFQPDPFDDSIVRLAVLASMLVTTIPGFYGGYGTLRGWPLARTSTLVFFILIAANAIFVKLPFVRFAALAAAAIGLLALLLARAYALLFPAPQDRNP